MSRPSNHRWLIFTILFFILIQKWIKKHMTELSNCVQDIKWSLMVTNYDLLDVNAQLEGIHEKKDVNTRVIYTQNCVIERFSWVELENKNTEQTNKQDGMNLWIFSNTLYAWHSSLYLKNWFFIEIPYNLIDFEMRQAGIRNFMFINNKNDIRYHMESTV